MIGWTNDAEEPRFACEQGRKWSCKAEAGPGSPAEIVGFSMIDKGTVDGEDGRIRNPPINCAKNGIATSEAHSGQQPTLAFASHIGLSGCRVRFRCAGADGGFDRLSR
jgi:hypothetical protein